MEAISKSKERTHIVELRGELDHHSVRDVIQQLELALESVMPKRLVLDFKGVTFMDSSGIALAVRAQRRMEKLGGSAALRSVPPQAKKVFDAAGITRMMPIIEEEKG